MKITDFLSPISLLIYAFDWWAFKTKKISKNVAIVIAIANFAADYFASYEVNDNPAV